MKRLKSKLDNLTQKGSNVYIIPSKDGFKYIFINFTLFLISLSYANNMALIITFLMVAYLILQMLDIHRTIQEMKFDGVIISDDYLTSDIFSIIHFENKITNLNSTIQAEFVLKDTKKLKLKYKKTIDNHTIQMKVEVKSRGKYEVDKIKLYTYGKSGLFYVWRYFDVNQYFFVYPQKKPAHTNKANTTNEAILNLTDEEFSNHIPYVKGLNSKRIDWKVFARKDILYWKKHIDYSSETIDINFNKLLGDSESKLEAMSFLIEKTFKDGHKWRLVLPNKVVETSKGHKHFKECMESISEF